MGYIRRDPRAYAKIWSKVIRPAIERYCAEACVSCPDVETARERVRDAYNRFNRQFSQDYMADPSKPLNQRKVAACYAAAIIEVRPLEIDYTDPRCTEAPLRRGRVAYECRPCFANERLAIHVACSILISFLRQALRDARCGVTDAERKVANAALDGGIDLLRDVDGGEFVLNFERTLSIMSLEGSYNTPLLACLFSYLEARVLPSRTYAKVLRVFALEAEGCAAERADEGGGPSRGTGAAGGGV